MFPKWQLARDLMAWTNDLARSAQERETGWLDEESHELRSPSDGAQNGAWYGERETALATLPVADERRSRHLLNTPLQYTRGQDAAR